MLIVMAAQSAVILILFGLVIWISRKWRASETRCARLCHQLEVETRLNGDLLRNCTSLLITEASRLAEDLKATPKPPAGRMLS